MSIPEKTIWKSGKKRTSDKQKSSSMYESSGSHFFRTTTGVQSRAYALEELR